MQLKGKKVLLRPPKPDELVFIKELWTDPKTMRNIGGIVKWDDRKMGKWYKRMLRPGNNKNFYFLIFSLANKPVGEVSFHRFIKKENAADLNIKIKHNYRGKGYARESLFLLLYFYFNHFGGKIIRDRVAINNILGQKFLQKFGFKKVETNKDYVLFTLNYEQFMKTYHEKEQTSLRLCVMKKEKYIDDYIQNITEALKEIANSENATKMKSYMRKKFEFYGIQSNPRREATRKFMRNEQRPSYANVKTLIKKLWQLSQREYQYFGMELLLKYKNEFDKKIIDLLIYMITHKSWWDTVDMIAKKLVGEYFMIFPQERDKYIQKWVVSNDLWLQRTTILFQLSYKQKTDVELLFSLITKLKDKDEFFIQKAIGWSLREYSKQDPVTVKNFIENNTLSSLSSKEGLKIINKSK